MKLNLLIKRLKQYNLWRRGANIEQPDPKQLGQDIEYAINTMEAIMKEYKYKPKDDYVVEMEAAIKNTVEDYDHILNMNRYPQLEDFERWIRDLRETMHRD